MGRRDGRIEKGQSLRSAISARAWNRAQDAADLVLGARTGVTVDGVTLPLVPALTIACDSTNAPACLFGEPRRISFGGSSTAVIPFGSPGGDQDPTEEEQEIAQRNAMLLGATAAQSAGMPSLHVNPVIGVCVDPVKYLFVIRGIVPVRVIAPLNTTTAAVAASLQCGILYGDENDARTWLKLVAAGGVRVSPYTPLNPTGSGAALPAQGWGVAVL